jgi:hypothetical protein
LAVATVRQTVVVFLATPTAWQQVATLQRMATLRRVATIAADFYDRAGGFERGFVSGNEVPEKNPI